MIDYFRKLILIIATLAVACGVSSSFAFAQSTTGLTIKPAVIEDNVKLGDAYHFSLSITNIASTDKTFYLSTQDIKGLNDNGNPIFAQPGEATGYELSSWIQLPSGSLSIAAGQTATIQLSAQVPSGAAPGAHFGAIFITDKASRPGSNGSGVGFTVGTIISLTIPGNAHEDAKLQEFSTGKVVYGSSKVDFNTKVENLGNVLVRPHGVIDISDMFGRKVATIAVNDSAAPVFPASERVYLTNWQSDSFVFGRYEAVGSFSYGDTEKKTISGITSFWILPLKPILIFLGTILGLILLMYISVKMYITKKLRDMGAAPGGRADTQYYAKKYQRSGSRLVVTTLVVFLFCIVFLGILFMMFA
jgi:hypothetical protein